MPSSDIIIQVVQQSATTVPIQIIAGAPGRAATVNIGSTVTGAPGSNASVTNIGTSSDAIFNFVIPRGADGLPATVSIGTTTTGAPGSSASVTNSGTGAAAILNFTIPRGATGDPGSPGQAATISIGTTTTGAPGSNASVTNSGTSSDAVFNFVIPRGAAGDPGQAATISIGTTTTGAPGTNASVTNGGTSSAAILNFTIPRGLQGDAATVSIGTTTTGAAGTDASVTNSGTSSAAILNFTIPRGAKGDTGDPGTPATVSIGTTTTGASGSNASVSNSGTASAAILNFTIPRGLQGDPGTPGAAATVSIGTTTTGAAGSSASVTNSGTSSAAVLNFVIPQGAAGPAGTDGVGFKTYQTLLTNFSTNQEATITGLPLAGNKWGVSVVEEWDSGPGDSSYSSVAALLLMNGTNGSTTFTDSGPGGLTFTASNSPTISTSQSKYGGASGLFNGSNQALLSTAAASAWAFLHNGTAFTVEAWFYTGSTAYQALVSTYSSSSTSGINIGINDTNARDVAVEIGRSVGGSVLRAQSAGGVWALNTWNHVAVVLNPANSTLRVYLNGVQVASVGSASFAFSSANPTYTLAVARYQGATPGGYFSGYLDDLRITNGVARYTAAFTAPTEQLPSVPPQVETKYVGQIGGLNDTDVDYGIEKLSDTSLKIRKMSATGNPVGGGALGSTVNRVYVNIQDFGATAASQVPAGGTTGQVLTKVNNTDYNVVWATPSAGGSVAWADITGKPSTFPPDTHLHGISDVTGLQGALDAKAPLASPTFTGTVSGITKSMVGLGNVDNTSDASKPISSATQTALDGKAATSHTHAIADVTGLQTALDGKQAAGSYAAASHTHGISDVTGLQTALDTKQKTITSGTAAPSGGVDGDFYFQYT
jgi:hypothetical protein